MKNYLKVLLCFMLMITLVACGNNESIETTPNEPTDAGVEETTNEEVVEETTEPAEESAEGTESTEATGEFTAEQPALLTSVGQSADVEMVKSMLDRVGVEFVSNNLATAEDIGDAKTLILAVGGSSKGLGAAGIDADAELDRVNALIDDAKEQGLSVVAAHIGGDARRGELSDRFIQPSFEKADYAIVVESGDSDGLMSGIANDNNIPIELISSITDTTTSLENIFN